MVAAKRQIERAEFEAVTGRLSERARHGRGRVHAVPAADTEDVVQDAWEKAVRQRRDLPVGKALEAHLQEALVDKSADYWRSRTRKKDVPPKLLVPLDSAVEDQVASLETEDEGKLAALRGREIFEALRKTVDAEATSYAVLDALDLSEAEIAIALKTSRAAAGAARKRVTRAQRPIAQAARHTPKTPKEIH
jgi:DNA-directed RNA polymerase specialized sigma24 family protein